MAEKAIYPTPAPATTATPSQTLYVITINISTYPTSTWSVWRNACNVWILILHLWLLFGNPTNSRCRVSLLLQASSVSSTSKLVDVEWQMSLNKRRRGLQTSHCLNILRPSYRAVIRNVMKKAPIRTSIELSFQSWNKRVPSVLKWNALSCILR